MQLSIIIPARDEAESIERTIRELKSLADKLPEFEILVVDDGSTDGTAELAQLQGVTVLRRAQTRGYGDAVRAGLEHAEGDTVVIYDADGRYDPKFIPSLVNAIRDGSADIVFGSAGPESPRVGLLRRVWMLLWGPRLRLYTSSFLAMRRETARKVPSEENGFAFLPEYITKASRLGLTVKMVEAATRARFAGFGGRRDSGTWLSRLKIAIGSRCSEVRPS